MGRKESNQTNKQIIKHKDVFVTLYLIEMPFNAFANRADPDQAALVKQSRPRSGSSCKTEQTQIRQLLQELPDQGLLCLLIEI